LVSVCHGVLGPVIPRRTCVRLSAAAPRRALRRLVHRS
jgi:hypothetical protein